MDSLDLQVLVQARDWREQGHAVWLVTVIETWGSAPRPPGALLAMREDGLVVGSVSGGCVEDDLIDRVRKGERVAVPSLVAYGVTQGRGGALRPAVRRQPAPGAGAACRHRAGSSEVLERTGRHELVARVVDLGDGSVRVEPARRGEAFAFDGKTMRALYGPRWRMLVIGAGQLSRALAQMALGLDFEVIVCDPREEYHLTWDVPGTTFSTAMPDDLAHRAAARPAHRRRRRHPRSQARRPGAARGAEVARLLRRRARLARQHRQAQGAARPLRPQRRRDRAPARADRPRHRQPDAGRDRGVDPGRDRRRQERHRADAEEAGRGGRRPALTPPA